MIIVRKDETIDSALRRFKRDVQASGALQKCKDREYYMNSSLKKKVKRERRQKNQKKR